MSGLTEDGWDNRAAAAIMTTDTVLLASREVRLAGGASPSPASPRGRMICPDMATMLAFVATDAQVPQPVLQAMLNHAVDRSFNSITVDGDTSTNDACVLLASGASGIAVEAWIRRWPTAVRGCPGRAQNWRR